MPRFHVYPNSGGEGYPLGNPFGLQDQRAEIVAAMDFLLQGF